MSFVPKSSRVWLSLVCPLVASLTLLFLCSVATMLLLPEHQDLTVKSALYTNEWDRFTIEPSEFPLSLKVSVETSRPAQLLVSYEKIGQTQTQAVVVELYRYDSEDSNSLRYVHTSVVSRLAAGKEYLFKLMTADGAQIAHKLQIIPTTGIEVLDAMPVSVIGSHTFDSLTFDLSATSVNDPSKEKFSGLVMVDKDCHVVWYYRHNDDIDGWASTKDDERVHSFLISSAGDEVEVTVEGITTGSRQSICNRGNCAIRRGGRLHDLAAVVSYSPELSSTLFTLESVCSRVAAVQFERDVFRLITLKLTNEGGTEIKDDLFDINFLGMSDCSREKSLLSTITSSYNGGGDNLVISLQHQKMVMGYAASRGKIQWVLPASAPRQHINLSKNTKLLTFDSEASKFISPSHCVMLSDGSLLLADTVAPSVYRARKYLVSDSGVVSESWSFGPAASSTIRDARVRTQILPSRNTLLILTATKGNAEMNSDLAAQVFEADESGHQTAYLSIDNKVNGYMISIGKAMHVPLKLEKSN